MAGCDTLFQCCMTIGPISKNIVFLFCAVPLGISNSLLRNLVPGDGTWFKIHQACNFLAFFVMTAAFGIAVHNVYRMEGSLNLGENRHRMLGLIVYLLVYVQIGMGIFRPHLPKHSTPTNSGTDSDFAESSDDGCNIEGQKSKREATPPSVEIAPCKSWSRIAFEIAHRILGYGLIGLSWYTAYLGINIMMDDYGISRRYLDALWIAASAVVGSVLGLYAIQHLLRRRESRRRCEA